MKPSLLIFVSALVQLAAAFLAFRMIKITRHVPGWILVSTALLLMGIRRLITLLGFQFPGLEATIRGIGAETIAISISILMLVSMVLIRRYFIRQNLQAERLVDSEQRYKELSDQLEHRVEKRTRELSNAVQRLQEFDRMKAEFLGRMSHELRTPLNAVIGFSDILLTGMDGELTEEQKKDVTLIFDSAQHLLSLINDILDTSKIETGGISLHPEMIQLNHAISESLTVHAETIRQKGLTLRQEFLDLPPVFSDPIRLEQILKNLLGNAVKFTDRGEIVVRTEWSNQEGQPLASGPEDGKGFIRTTIQDTGIGIPEEEYSAIFDEFHQSDSGLSRQYEGSGLGLSITRNLVELQGGKVGVESQPAKGSCFWFTLPTFNTQTITEREEQKKVV